MEPKMIEVEEDFHNALLLYAENNRGNDDKPNFKPQEDMGEGEPTREEQTYRAELLLLLGAFFSRTVDALQTKHPNSYKISRIENLGKEWIFTSQQAIERHLSKIFQSGVKDMNRQLKEVGIAPQNRGVNIRYYTLLEQQQANMIYIANQIHDKLGQQLRIQELERQFKTISNARTKPLPNNAFNTALKRADAAASYGSNVAYMIGQQAAAEPWKDIIQVDWLTAHDSKVCMLCQSYEEGGPYKIDKIPIIPHNWCRCRLRIHKAPEMNVNPLIPLTIIDQLDDYRRE